MATSKGLGLVFGSKGTITLYTAAISPTAPAALLTGGISTIESYDITHEGDVEQIKNGQGETVAQVVANERLAISVTFIPSGSTAANALLGAGLPAVNGYATISGADSISIGGTANAINGDWVYAGGGSVRFTQSGKAMVTIPLTRYLGTGALTGAAANFTV